MSLYKYWSHTDKGMPCTVDWVYIRYLMICVSIVYTCIIQDTCMSKKPTTKVIFLFILLKQSLVLLHFVFFYDNIYQKNKKPFIMCQKHSSFKTELHRCTVIQSLLINIHIFSTADL